MLDKFENETGLPEFVYNNEVHTFLNMKRDGLNKLTPEECGEGSYLLRQFGFHLQRAFNREISKAGFLEKQIRKVVANEVSQYKAAQADERRELAVKGNTHAKELESFRKYHQARADRLAFLAKTVADMAYSLEGLQQTKRNQRPC